MKDTPTRSQLALLLLLSSSAAASCAAPASGTKIHLTAFFSDEDD